MTDQQNKSSYEDMSLLEHLGELRKRLFYSVCAVLILFAVCWVFVKPIFAFVSAPILDVLPENQDSLYVKQITEAFTLYMKVAFFAAIFFASPVIITQIWLFISPGLYKRERIMAIPFILFSTIFFIGGGLFGYYVAFPRLCGFLLGYADNFGLIITASEYFSFFTKILLGLGIVFEIPTLIFFLARLGLVSAGFLIRKSKYAVLIIFIVAAVITPTPDIPTQMLFATPMMILYAIGILLAWIFGKKRHSTGEPD